MTPPDKLRLAKRDLEKIGSQIHSVLLANRCKVPATDADYNEAYRRFGLTRDKLGTDKDHPAWHEIYYGGVVSKKGQKALAELRKLYPDLAAKLEPLAEQAVAMAAAVDTARAEEKAAKQANRDARAAKAKKKKELGVDLNQKGGVAATEATYLALRSGLKPIETALAEHFRKHWRDRLDKWIARLAENAGSLDIVFPRRDHRGNIVPNQFDAPVGFFKHFKLDLSVGRNIATLLAFVSHDKLIAADAATAADEQLAGFCAKLAGKIDTELSEQSNGVLAGKVERVTMTTTSIWENSILTVATNYGMQVWHTKVIVNFSVYNKAFNQWPTRRIS